MKWLKTILLMAVVASASAVVLTGCESENVKSSDQKMCASGGQQTCCCAKTCDKTGKCQCNCDACKKTGGCKDCKCSCKTCTCNKSPNACAKDKSKCAPATKPAGGCCGSCGK